MLSYNLTLHSICTLCTDSNHAIILLLIKKLYKELYNDIDTIKNFQLHFCHLSSFYPICLYVFNALQFTAFSLFWCFYYTWSKGPPSKWLQWPYNMLAPFSEYILPFWHDVPALDSASKNPGSISGDVRNQDLTAMCWWATDTF